MTKIKNCHKILNHSKYYKGIRGEIEKLKDDTGKVVKKTSKTLCSLENFHNINENKMKELKNNDAEKFEKILSDMREIYLNMCKKSIGTTEIVNKKLPLNATLRKFNEDAMKIVEKIDNYIKDLNDSIKKS